MAHKYKDSVWSIDLLPSGMVSHANAELAVLMDIREELKALHATMSILKCHNFIRIPHVLEAIRRNTNKPKKAAKPRLRRLK